MEKKWDKDKVFEVSHLYNCRSQFKKGHSTAFRLAYLNGWLEEMTWLVHPKSKPLRWTKDAVFAEARKYELLKDFREQIAPAYNAALKKGWLTEMTWLKYKYGIDDCWKNKDKVLAESKKYNSFAAFARNCPSAYRAAKRYGWLDEMTWIKERRKPDGYWQIKKNVIEESRKYNNKGEFCRRASAAYNSALVHGWISEMTWLDSGRRPLGYWKEKSNVVAAARKCSSRSEFHRIFPMGYNAAKKNKWIDEFDWMKPKQIVSGRMISEPIHLIYVYLDEKNKMAYVGATKDIKERDRQHRSRKGRDAVYSYFTAQGEEIPKPIILQTGLVPIERQAEERLWSLHYMDHGYTLLNKLYNTGVGIGSLGGGPLLWTKEKVLFVAKKFCRIKDFMTKESGAYDAAQRYGMMNIETLPHFYRNRKPRGYWKDKEHVFDESRKYRTLREFEQGTPAAHFAARKNRWIDEMSWLERDQVPQGYWKYEENAIRVAKQCKSRKEFKKKSSAAYNYINENNLWYKVPELDLKCAPVGKWQIKENVIAESKKYSTRIDFKNGSPTAYSSATKNKWIDEMTWLISSKKTKGYWNVKERVMQEGKHFDSRVPSVGATALPTILQ